MLKYKVWYSFLFFEFPHTDVENKWFYVMYKAPQ